MISPFSFLCLMSFLLKHFFDFYLPVFYHPCRYKLKLLAHFSTVPLIWYFLLIQIPNKYANYDHI